jgi:hypothetical protein
MFRPCGRWLGYQPERQPSRKSGRKNGPQALRLAVRLTHTYSDFKRFDVSTASDIRLPAGQKAVTAAAPATPVPSAPRVILVDGSGDGQM